jgi:glutathione S-transferase
MSYPGAYHQRPVSKGGFVIKLYEFPLSTNCDRVLLALGHKGLPVERVEIDPGNRSLVRQVSGQTLVPVIEHEGKVIHDSMTIIRYIEAQFPGKPLFPADPARRAEMDLFLDWFNRVWKRPPNEMETEMGKPSPDQARIGRLGKAIRGYMDLFESLLAGRDYLMGAFSAADCAAHPFFRFSLFYDESDPWLFHRILMEHQRLGEDHPRLEAYIRRVEEHPKA